MYIYRKRFLYVSLFMLHSERFQLQSLILFIYSNISLIILCVSFSYPTPPLIAQWITPFTGWFSFSGKELFGEDFECRRCKHNTLTAVWLKERRWIWNCHPRRLIQIVFAVRCSQSIIVGVLGNAAQFQLLLSLAFNRRVHREGKRILQPNKMALRAAARREKRMAAIADRALKRR